MRFPEIFLASIMCCVAVQSATAAECLRYEPATVMLPGIVSLRNGFGPPGFGEDPAHDSKESWYVITLDSPICVRASPNDLLNGEAESDVMEMQIVLRDGFSSYRDWIGKHVAITGTLFHAITAHHRTAVLVTEFSAKILQ